MYFFYKNFCFTLLQFIYGFYCNFTGQTIIDDWFISCYNLAFTSLPLGAKALLDHDIKPSDGKIANQMLPFLYAENRDYPIFTMINFILTLLKGAIHCCINFFVIIYLYIEESMNDRGQMGGLWFISVNLYTCVLMIVSVDLIIFTKYHTYFNFLIPFICTLMAYIIFLICVHNSIIFKSVGTIQSVFSSFRFWLSFIFVSGTCGIFDYLLLCYRFNFKISLKNILQRLLSEKNVLNEDYKLPKPISKRINMYKTFEQQKVHLESEKYKIPQDSDIKIDVQQPLDTIYDENENNNQNNENINTICENSNDISHYPMNIGENSCDYSSYPMNTPSYDDIYPNYQAPSGIDDFLGNL